MSPHARGLKKLLRVDGLAVAVVSQHVGEPDECGLTPSASSAWWRSIAVASRFGSAQRRASTPPTSAWSSEPGAPCGGAPRGARRAVDLRRVAGVGVSQDELADVVEQRGAEQLIAVVVLHLARETVGGGLGGDGVEPEVSA